ncbi:AAA-ATPase At1g43910-like [Corylus avellana]|uniref:AAA-ATPase At1g43910-like n=1 Tax=Corylus avellana TaxID=13451 RepID=UPI001E2165FE|nr:AAA-ATPase At1g43910-like [Corylus avellana]
MMENLSMFMPSASTLLSAYALASTFFLLVNSIFEQIPQWLKDYMNPIIWELQSRFCSDFIFEVEDEWGVSDNEIFRAAMTYLPTRSGPTTPSLLVGSEKKCEQPGLGIPIGGQIVDEFQGMRLTWRLYSRKTRETIWNSNERKFFRLSCKKSCRQKVLDSYLPHVIRTSQSILNKLGLRIYTYDQDYSYWRMTAFRHPSTFETLAMDPEKKQFIMEDLDLFTSRKGFFDTTGKTWKRGYLLYGPPGTGKSSLVAAIANHLRYNVYDIQLSTVKSDSVLRQILTSTTNRSILLFEDIDCSTKVSHDRVKKKEKKASERPEPPDKPEKSDAPGITLSGLLNFIDGIWSSCGEERIIIFTTNYKEKLEPALLRPGRMDVHIHMGYCTPAGFRVLAGTHLGIKDHIIFGKIEALIQAVEVTPAEVAQQLMTSKKPEVALEGLAEFLITKKSEIKRAEPKKDKEEGQDDKQSREKHRDKYMNFVSRVFCVPNRECHQVDHE